LSIVAAFPIHWQAGTQAYLKATVPPACVSVFGSACWRWKAHQHTACSRVSQIQPEIFHHTMTQCLHRDRGQHMKPSLAESRFSSSVEGKMGRFRCVLHIACGVLWLQTALALPDACRLVQMRQDTARNSNDHRDAAATSPAILCKFPERDAANSRISVQSVLNTIDFGDLASKSGRDAVEHDVVRFMATEKRVWLAAIC
jgi:hypothetical protein